MLVQIHSEFLRIWPQYVDKVAMEKVNKWIGSIGFGKIFTGYYSLYVYSF